MTIVLTAPSSFPNSFALEGYYEPAVREINQQPTICIFEPDDPRVDEKTWQRWLSDAKAAIDEWESILKQRSTTAHAKWNIEVVEIPKEKQFLYNPEACNIEVYFTDTPLPDDPSALGWYYVGMGLIEMLYIQSEFCGREYFPEYGFYFNTYCFKDSLERPKKMAAVLQHELGHAFGLGHYLPYTQEQLDGWQNHPLGQPSIMTFAHHNEEQMKIQKLDIDKIFEVYSAMGFGRTKNENPVFIEIEPEEPELDFDFSGNVQQVIVERGKIVTHTISGYVPEYLYSRGMPVEFQMEFPDSSVHESAIVVTGHKYYEVPLPFSWESQKGEYKIIVQYNGMEIQTAIINVGTESSTIPKQPTFSPEPSHIPTWIKNNAKWWSEGAIGDSGFFGGIQYMIKENIMVIPDLPEEVTQMELKDEKRAMGMEREQNVPDWVRNNARWWADGLISDDDFISGIKYLVEQGIIQVS